MTEHDIQYILTKHWRKDDFIINGDTYSLVCWELMFPSWKINDNRGKWNEASIDFIFYSAIENTILCAELKDAISGNQKLLSAYCQTKHRSIKFLNQYSVEKIEKARIECFSNASLDRGGKSLNLNDIHFRENPKVKMILMAMQFPNNAVKQINSWDQMDTEELLTEISNYKKVKEFDRFKNLSTEELVQAANNNVEIISIKSIVDQFSN